MKRRWLLSLTAAIALLTPAASFAADITGKWVGEMGGEFMSIAHEGTINGDEISLTIKMDGGPGGGPPGPIKLKRAK